MSDDNQPHDLTRRKVLGSIGALGVGAALGGAGTAAFFSDEETFEDNRLVAGELDLKVDWEEHYAFPQIYGFDDPATGLDVTRSEPDTPADYTPLPDPANPLVWVHDDDLDAFMDNTAIESFPDVDDDGIQDAFAAESGTMTQDGVGYICEDGADTPEDLDPAAGWRTANADTVDENGDPLPLINLDDVKPGDFGELTLSFHLCDNPGYVWLQGRPVWADENGHSEPEAADDDENGTANESFNVDDGDTIDDVLNADVELLDEIHTTWWYDTNGDNVIGGGGQQAAGKADIAFLMDRSVSMSDERNFLKGEISSVATQLAESGVDAQFGLVPYEDGTSDDGSNCTTFVATDITDDPDALDFSYSTCGGTENASEAIDFALDELSWRSDSKKVIVVLTDENDDGSQQERQDALDRIDTEDACLLAVSRDVDGEPELKWMASQVDCGTWTEISDGLSQENIAALIQFVGEVVGTEPVFFSGSLRESLAMLSQGDGLLLDGDISSDSGGIDPFQPSTTNYIGFTWYLPVDHANEIQTDSVGFDLGFYTEQARHNDPIEANVTANDN